MLAAPPSPVYENLRGTTKPIVFGYHRLSSLTGADRWLEGNEKPAPALAPTAGAGTAGLPENFVFSASSLEKAMESPRQFYFQYILNIPQAEKTDLSRRGRPGGQGTAPAAPWNISGRRRRAAFPWPPS